MGEFPTGAKATRRLHLSSSMRIAHGRRPGWLHGEQLAEPDAKPSGKLTEGQQ